MWVPEPQHNDYKCIDISSHDTLCRRILSLATFKCSVTADTAQLREEIVGDIFTPRDYIVISESARIRPSPYHVSQVYHHDMMKLSGSYVSSIRPGKRAGAPTVHNLNALE